MAEETTAKARKQAGQESLMPLGIVVERRELKSRWQRAEWRPVAVFLGAPPRDPKGDWAELKQGEGWAQYHAGTLPLALFRKETEAYRLALSQSPPKLFVVLRPNEDPAVAHDAVPFLVTASPYEAQDYLDSGADVVEAVAMPEPVRAFLQAFIDSFHEDVPFVKRQRTKWGGRKGGVGRRSSLSPGRSPGRPPESED